MNGRAENLFDDKLFQPETPDTLVSVKDDAYADSSGLFGNNQVFGLLATDTQSKIDWWIPYSSIIAGEAGPYQGTQFSFQFMVGEKKHEVTIRGNPKNPNAFGAVIYRLAAGQRKIMHADGNTILSIEIGSVV